MSIFISNNKVWEIISKHRIWFSRPKSIENMFVEPTIFNDDIEVVFLSSAWSTIRTMVSSA
jgi:hypothetical protein